MSTILSSSISSSYSSTTSSLTSSLGSIVSAAPQQENQRVFTIDPRVVRSRLEGGQGVSKLGSQTEQKMPIKVQSTEH